MIKYKFLYKQEVDTFEYNYLKNVYLHMVEVEVTGRFLSSSGSSSKGGIFDFDDLVAP
jgi:hypothetical protein